MLPMRVLLSTYGSRGAVAPKVALAARLQEPGAEVRISAQYATVADAAGG